MSLSQLPRDIQCYGLLPYTTDVTTIVNLLRTSQQTRRLAQQCVKKLTIDALDVKQYPPRSLNPFNIPVSLIRQLPNVEIVEPYIIANPGDEVNVIASHQHLRQFTMKIAYDITTEQFLRLAFYFFQTAIASGNDLRRYDIDIKTPSPSDYIQYEHGYLKLPPIKQAEYNLIADLLTLLDAHNALDRLDVGRSWEPDMVQLLQRLHLRELTIDGFSTLTFDDFLYSLIRLLMESDTIVTLSLSPSLRYSIFEIAGSLADFIYELILGDLTLPQSMSMKPVSILLPFEEEGAIKMIELFPNLREIGLYAYNENVTILIDTLLQRAPSLQRIVLFTSNRNINIIEPLRERYGQRVGFVLYTCII
jgi:hypothetical protein